MTIVAQGNALGTMIARTFALKGQNKCAPFCNALSGLETIWDHLTQGVALGYDCVGLSAR
jgi:hypothetical protein